MQTGTLEWNNGWFRVYCNYSITPNEAKNTALVAADLFVTKLKSGATAWSTFPVTLSIAGTNSTKSVAFDARSWSVGRTEKLHTMQKALTHRQDGTHAAITISFYGSTGTMTLSTFSGSKTITPNPIKRIATVATIPGSGTTGKTTIRIQVTRQNASFVSRLYVSKNGSTEKIYLDWVPQGLGLWEKSWLIPASLAQWWPRDEEGTVTIGAETYTSDRRTLLGATGVSVRVQVDESVRASVSSLRVEAGKNAFQGLILQNFTEGRVKGTLQKVDTAALQGARFVEIRVKTDDSARSYTLEKNPERFPPKTSELNTPFLAPRAGRFPYTVELVDSRGRTFKQGGYYTVEAYFLPKIHDFKCARCTASGVLDEAGENVRADFSVEIAGLQNKNSAKIQFYYKDQTRGEVLATSASMAAGKNTFKSYVILPRVPLEGSRLFIMRVTDATGAKSEAQYLVSSGYVLIDVTRRGAAIGTTAEDGCQRIRYGDFALKVNGTGVHTERVGNSTKETTNLSRFRVYRMQVQITNGYHQFTRAELGVTPGDYNWMVQADYIASVVTTQCALQPNGTTMNLYMRNSQGALIPNGRYWITLLRM